MGLFDKFTDTIIYKPDSELRNRYAALSKLIKEYPDNEELSKEYQVIKAGLAGEDEIEYQLRKSHIGMYVLRDVKVRYEDLTAQIDYVVITPLCQYLIECKNLTGNIIVDEKGDFIREMVVNGKKIRKGMYSPLRQVEAQREVLRKIWENSHHKLVKFIFSSSFDKAKRVLVVAANKGTILNTSHAPREIKYKILRADSLVKQLQYDLDHAERKDILFSQKDMENFAQQYIDILDKTIPEDFYEIYKERFIVNTENQKVSNDKPANENNTDNELKEKLMRFRKFRSKGMNVPAYYIFTNDELEKLIELKPTTIDELRNYNILPPVKVNLHGQLIVDVISGRVFE